MLAWALTAGLLALAPPGEAPRGNTVLTQDRGVILGVAAVPRASILIGDGRRVIQPAGFGAELQFRPGPIFGELVLADDPSLIDLEVHQLVARGQPLGVDDRDFLFFD